MENPLVIRSIACYPKRKNFFAGDTMALKIIRLLMLAFFLRMAAPATLRATESDALVLSVTPSVISSVSGEAIPLALKMEVPVSAVLTSDARGKAQLMFPDSSTVSIAPGTEIALADFVDSETEQSVILNLASGTARIITGEVSRRNPGAFTVNTPQASVGIRGTIVTISTMGDTTRIFLTETSGLGVFVRDLNTGRTLDMRTPGNLLTIGPDGMRERRAEPNEAQHFNTVLRGAAQRTGRMLAPIGDDQNTMIAGALAPSGPLDPGITSEWNMLEPSPVVPEFAGLDINLINGSFYAEGNIPDPINGSLTAAWLADFNVDAAAIISGAELGLNGEVSGFSAFSTGGSGSINADGSFSIGDFTGNTYLSSTTMSGRFDSPTDGTLSFSTQYGDGQLQGTGALAKIQEEVAP